MLVKFTKLKEPNQVLLKQTGLNANNGHYTILNNFRISKPNQIKINVL